MKRICIATGCFHEFGDINKQIEIIRDLKLDVEGVELSFHDIDQLFNFKLTEDNLKFLKGLHYNSIHAPMKFYFEDNDISRKVIESLTPLYREINAYNVLTHANRVNYFTDILNSEDNWSIETPRSAKMKFEEFKGITEKFTKLKVILDVSHVSDISLDNTKRYVENFQNKIMAVHLSAVKDGKQHQPLYSADKNFLESIKLIKILNCPIIIETEFSKDNFQKIEDELGFIKQFFDENV